MGEILPWLETIESWQEGRHHNCITYPNNSIWRMQARENEFPKNYYPYDVHAYTETHIHKFNLWIKLDTSEFSIPSDLTTFFWACYLLYISVHTHTHSCIHRYQFLDTHLPWTVPQGYCLAFTILFPTLTSSLLPTTAKGRWPCNEVLYSTILIILITHMKQWVPTKLTELKMSIWHNLQKKKTTLEKNNGCSIWM